MVMKQDSVGSRPTRNPWRDLDALVQAEMEILNAPRPSDSGSAARAARGQDVANKVAPTASRKEPRATTVARIGRRANDPPHRSGEEFDGLLSDAG